MEEPMAGTGTHWCHLCRQVVSPPLEFDTDIKCPICQSGFIEEMGPDGTTDNQDIESEFGSDRALSLWAPILLGMMGNPRRRRRRHRVRRFGFDGELDEPEDHGESRHGGDADLDLDRELESMLRTRRRRSSATILQLLQSIRTGLDDNENENSDNDRSTRDGEGEGNAGRDRERVILINPFNQTIIVHGPSHDSNQSQNPIGSLGDYFIGPGLELLLQHLAENDPNRYGTPPAQKEVVEAMPTVEIQEILQCSVCLDDLEVGAEAREMPCKHKFHNDCILPWLELHSSCPVCRYQLPAEESKRESDGSRFNNNESGNMNGGSGVSTEEGPGSQAHSEGNGNTNTNTNTVEGLGNRAHSEGNGTTVEGLSSEAHPEENGNTAEGQGCQAHEEGNTSKDGEHDSQAVVEENSSTRDGNGDGENRSGRRFGILWPFSGLFSSGNSSSSS